MAPATLIVRRYGSPWPKVLKNGDKYDSTIDVYDRLGRHLHHVPYTNTDHTRRYRGGVLMPGQYNGITGPHRGKPALWLYRDSAGKAQRWQDITLDMRTLPSLIPNPNHNGRHQMTYINCHPGGREWDWSHGCLTVLLDWWPDLIGLFDGLKDRRFTWLIETYPENKKSA
jgi:hypothetical protein